MFTLLDLCVSSLRRGHANLLCIVPILTDDPRRESKIRRASRLSRTLAQLLLCCSRPWTGRALAKGTRTRSSNLCLVLPSTLLRIFLEKGNSTPATTLWEARKWCRGRARQPAKRPMVGRKADSTLRSSQAVPHPSTNRALSCLTSEVERDPVHSTRYGRQRRAF